LKGDAGKLEIVASGLNVTDCPGGKEWVDAFTTTTTTTTIPVHIDASSGVHVSRPMISYDLHSRMLLDPTTTWLEVSMRAIQ
jgi:hypothetical protein